MAERNMAIRRVEPGIMASRDFTYRAAKYAHGGWQLEGPEGLNEFVANRKLVKVRVREHQQELREARKQAEAKAEQAPAKVTKVPTKRTRKVTEPKAA